MKCYEIVFDTNYIYADNEQDAFEQAVKIMSYTPEWRLAEVREEKEEKK